jgi:hypothetical protein
VLGLLFVTPKQRLIKMGQYFEAEILNKKVMERGGEVLRYGRTQ